ncbi:hypothetical protein GQ367_01765 [Polynucleobacter sp. MWH-CaK5]|uniref:hypothetical protein n=1 Tax=Polynucleobacter sp. MWH-CaK5 TaxID=2689107 RepID=UPI001BFDEE8C|nr:hypothetical protein [Polynucleobacter sp. MWH-CaK5]QWD89228.1 hypothetical protein GQ367_01765 [Polynucleobacter sp. MWH-CaK5]
MKTNKNSIQRNFPYQHPTFGRVTKIKHPDSWKKTVYYWWWSYLKRNQEYLKCCEVGGKGKLDKLYRDFGDVRSDDFQKWWSEDDRGANLFSNPVTESTVRLLEIGDVVTEENQLTVSFPLSLPKRHLKKRLNDLLKKHHKGQKGVQQAKKSKAKYQFKGQPNLEGLERALKVYDHLEELKLRGVKKPQWKVAMDLDILRDEDRLKPSDSPKEAEAKRRVITAIVGRLKRKASDSVRNTSKGLFP